MWIRNSIGPSIEPRRTLKEKGFTLDVENYLARNYEVDQKYMI